jgi:hypothetical protein
VTAWLICGVIAAVLGLLVWGLARAAGHEMPSFREVQHAPGYEPDPPWQPDPSRFGRCPSCGTHRPLADGLLADHDRPDPQVPFNVQSFPCRGAGQAPMQAEETER